MDRPKNIRQTNNTKALKAKIASARRAKAVRLGWTPIETVGVINLKLELSKNDEVRLYEPSLKNINHG